MESPRGLCATHCPYCALQCGMHVVPPRAERSNHRQPEVSGERRRPLRERLVGSRHAAPSRATSYAARARRERRAGAVEWDEALERITSGVSPRRRAYGRDAVGVFGGGSLTNEKAYLLGKFARVALGTANIDYNGRFCMSSAAAAASRAFGIDRGLPFPLEDIPRAEADPARRRQSGRDDAADHAVLRGAAAQRRRADRRRSPANADRSVGEAASASAAGYRCGAGQRPPARPHSRRLDRHRLHPRSHRRFRGGAPAGGGVLARAGGTDNRRAAAAS